MKFRYANARRERIPRRGRGAAYGGSMYAGGEVPRDSSHAR